MAALTSRGHLEDESLGTSCSMNTDSAIGADNTVIMVGWAQGGNVVEFTPSGGGLTWTVDSLHQSLADSMFIASANSGAGLSSGTAMSYTTDANMDLRTIAIFSINDGSMVAGDADSLDWNGASDHWECNPVNFPASEGFVVCQCAQYTDGGDPGQANHTPGGGFSELVYFASATTVTVWIVMDEAEVTSPGSVTPSGDWLVDPVVAFNVNQAVAYHAATAPSGPSKPQQYPVAAGRW